MIRRLAVDDATHLGFVPPQMIACESRLCRARLGVDPSVPLSIMVLRPPPPKAQRLLVDDDRIRGDGICRPNARRLKSWPGCWSCGSPTAGMQSTNWCGATTVSVQRDPPARCPLPTVVPGTTRAGLPPFPLEKLSLREAYPNVPF